MAQEKWITSDYFYGIYRLFEPPVWPSHEARSMDYFHEAASKGELRALFKLGKVTLLTSDKRETRAVGMMWLEKAAKSGYRLAEAFLSFYRQFPEPITAELLDSVTLDTEEPYLLCLAGTDADTENALYGLDP